MAHNPANGPINCDQVDYDWGSFEGLVFDQLFCCTLGLKNVTKSNPSQQILVWDCWIAMVIQFDVENLLYLTIIDLPHGKILFATL